MKEARGKSAFSGPTAEHTEQVSIGLVVYRFIPGEQSYLQRCEAKKSEPKRAYIPR
jgi:hypothetical protein